MKYRTIPNTSTPGTAWFWRTLAVLTWFLVRSVAGFAIGLFLILLVVYANAAT